MPEAHPVQLIVDDDLRRSRPTVFFRLVLVLPHLLWLGLWGIAVAFTALANWLATLILGRSPAELDLRARRRPFHDPAADRDGRGL